MKSERTMTPFEHDILKRVIELYIETGRPVGSSTLRKFYGLTVSTANIRNVLHSLGEQGFLYKTHISSGRVPSDLGYRCYVDGLDILDTLSNDYIAEIRRKIGQEWQEVKAVMSVTSRLLSEMTNYMGLMMGVFSSSGTVERLQIVRLEAAEALIILRLHQQRERKVIIDFPKRYPAYIIDRAQQIINERITGRPLHEAPGILDSFLREGAGIEREIAAAISTEAGYLFDWVYDLEYYFRGLDGSVGGSELNDPRLLQDLVRLMGERSLMVKVLRNRMEQELLVTIGHENDLQELERFSMITQRFSTGECIGLLGVLGPTRMSYGLVLSLLRKVADELNHLELKS